MSDIVSEVSSSGAEEEVRDVVQTVVQAEQDGLDIVDSGSQKNSHFELRFADGTDDEVYVYVERLEYENGIEVMVWADESYFRGVSDDSPTVSQGGDELDEFVTVLFDYIVDELPGEHSVDVVFRQYAEPSMVFSDVFYLN